MSTDDETEQREVTRLMPDTADRLGLALHVTAVVTLHAAGASVASAAGRPTGISRS